MKNYCFVCKQERIFTETESPSGYYLCGSCGVRTSFGTKKLIKGMHGVEFKEVVHR